MIAINHFLIRILVLIRILDKFYAILELPAAFTPVNDQIRALSVFR